MGNDYFDLSHATLCASQSAMAAKTPHASLREACAIDVNEAHEESSRLTCPEAQSMIGSPAEETPGVRI